MEQTINLLGFLCEAFGQNEKIYKDIDSVYRSRKYECYRLAKEHELYTNQIITEGSLLQEEYSKKALGILLYQQANPDDEKIISETDMLFRKGWPYVCAYLNHSEISLSKFLEQYCKKNGGIDRLTDDDLNTNITVLLVLAMSSGKAIVKDDFYNKTMDALLGRQNHYTSGEYKITISGLTEEEKKSVGILKNLVFKQIGKITSYHDMITKLKDDKRGDILSFLFDYENMTSSILDGVKFTDKDVAEILHLYTLIYPDMNHIDVDKAVSHYLYSIYIKCLIKAYKQVKQHYFANNKEIMYAELEHTENELKKARQTISTLAANKEESISENDELRRKINSLESQLQKEEQKNDELNALREFVFSLDTEIEFKEAPIDYDGLKSSRLIILGGHERWQSKMKEYLPEGVFIHPDMMNFDLSLVDGAEAIFICVNYLNHSIYYRLMEYAKGKSKKIFYINRQNEKLVLMDMQKKLRENMP